VLDCPVEDPACPARPGAGRAGCVRARGSRGAGVGYRRCCQWCDETFHICERCLQGQAFCCEACRAASGHDRKQTYWNSPEGMAATRDRVRRHREEEKTACSAG
jgi:hypothetical protein